MNCKKNLRLGPTKTDRLLRIFKNWATASIVQYQIVVGHNHENKVKAKDEMRSKNVKSFPQDTIQGNYQVSPSIRFIRLARTVQMKDTFKKIAYYQWRPVPRHDYYDQGTDFLFFISSE